LLEKGRQMLRKDNLLDEEVASRQELEQLSTDEKLTRLEAALDETFERLTTLTEKFNGVQQQFKQRITKAEPNPPLLSTVTATQTFVIALQTAHHEDRGPNQTLTVTRITQLVY